MTQDGAAPIRVTGSLAIDPDEIQESFVRAAGPGGQHVNTTSTAVQLRFDVRRSPSLPEDVRERLTRLGGRRIDSDGVLMIEAHRYRTRERNRADARARLAALIAQAAVRPKPRIATRPTRASTERRLETKRKQSSSKRMRRAPSDHD